MVSGTRGHGQDLAAGAEQRAGPLQAGHGVAQQFPERDDQQVAHGVVVQGAAAALAGREAVLHDVAPGAAPVGVVAQRGQGHPEIPGRQDAVLFAQPAGGSAVVRHGDDRGQLGGQQPQRGQRGREAVAAAERDDGGALVLLAGAGRAGGGTRGSGPVSSAITRGPGPGASWSR